MGIKTYLSKLDLYGIVVEAQGILYAIPRNNFVIVYVDEENFLHLVQELWERRGITPVIFHEKYQGEHVVHEFYLIRLGVIVRTKVIEKKEAKEDER